MTRQLLELEGMKFEEKQESFKVSSYAKKTDI